MEYPGDAFHIFLDLDSEIHLAVNGTVYKYHFDKYHNITHPKYLKLCSEDKQNFYVFGTTRG